MQSLLFAASAERLAHLTDVLRPAGYQVQAASSLREDDRTPYVIVFLDLALGVPKVTELCRSIRVRPQAIPPLVAVVGRSLPDADFEALLREGASMHFPDDPDALAHRVRLLRSALEMRAQMGGLVADLRASEERYRVVLAAIDEALIVQSEDGTVTTVNPAAGRILGLTEEEVRLRRWRGADWDITLADGTPVPPDELPSIRALRTGQAVRGCVLGMTRRGRPTVWISVNSHPVTSGAADARAIAVVTTFSDISPRRHAEAEFRATLESAVDAVFVHRQGRVVWANAKAAELLGYDGARALQGLSMLDMVSPRFRAIVAERIRRVAEGQHAPALEEVLVRRDGSEVHVVVTGSPTLFDGEPAVVATARDLTEKRRLETQLVAADRLASLGRLAAGVGHEINNPLAYVMGNVERAIERVRAEERSPELLAFLTDALEGAERIRRIVRDLKAFSSRGGEDRDLEAIDVHRVIESCVKMAHAQIRQRARLTLDLAGAPQVLGSEARLAQIFLNLIVNAAEAIPEGAAGDATVRITTRMEADGRVAVRVEDSGVGIAPEDLPHVLEPFYTTKAHRGGTGLGLSICQMLVASQRGEMSIESTLGRGTCVTVRLVPAARATEARAGSAAHAAVTTRRRVLFVDDEVRIARLMKDGLPEHEVTLASSGREALGRIEAGETFDAIVCDLMMPDLSGIDVYERLQRSAPGMARRMVFITGGAFTPRAVRFLAQVDNMCLEKPFPMSDLRSAIGRVCGD